MQDSFADFMKKEVIRYVKEEIDKGHSTEKIKRALLKSGHKHDLIEEAILALKKENFDLERALKEPIQSETLEQELYAEVLSSLIEYIQFQQKQGYSIDEIKNILLRYGHSKEILEDAVSAIKKDGKRAPNLNNIKFGLLLTLFLVFIFLVSYSTGDGFDKVFIGFFPTTASLVLIGIMINRVTLRQSTFLWLAPFVFVAVFFILGQSQSYDVLSKMDIIKLSILNISISMVAAIILINPARDEAEPEPMKDLVKERHKKEGKEKEEIKEIKEEIKTKPRMKIKEMRPA